MSRTAANRISVESFYVHPQALVESMDIGPSTRIWAFAHVMDGARIGSHCNIGDHAFIESGAIVGDRVTVKNGVAIWGRVTIEDNVFLAPNCVFTNDLNPRSYIKKSMAELTPTLVCENATIGANATIVCGVTIGSVRFRRCRRRRAPILAGPCASGGQSLTANRLDVCVRRKSPTLCRLAAGGAHNLLALLPFLRPHPEWLVKLSSRKPGKGASAMTTATQVRIPLIDLRAQYDFIREEVLTAVNGVLDSAQFVGGEWVDKFEEQFSRAVGSGYAVGVGSGTAALELALKVSGIGSGAEVIVPANSFFATAEAVSNVGAIPVFADVDPLTFHLDASSVESRITDQTRAIIPSTCSDARWT